MVANVTRNMHPVYHKWRREVRVKPLIKAYRNDGAKIYVRGGKYRVSNR